MSIRSTNVYKQESIKIGTTTLFKDTCMNITLSIIFCTTKFEMVLSFSIVFPNGKIQYKIT